MGNTRIATTATTSSTTAAEFDEAFTAVMPKLRRRLLTMVGNPHDADDLLQETYPRLSAGPGPVLRPVRNTLAPTPARRR